MYIWSLCLFFTYSLFYFFKHLLFTFPLLLMLRYVCLLLWPYFVRTHVCGIVHDNKMVFIRWKCTRVKASKRTKVKNLCNKTCMWHVLLCVLYHFESCLYINVQKTGKKKGKYILHKLCMHFIVIIAQKKG